jgi:hypothetical protein
VFVLQKEIQMSSRQRFIPALAAASLLTVVATGSIARATPPRAQGGAVQFDTPTVVDNYRPGFEPDVAVAKNPGGNDVTYTSVPFGFSTTQSFIYRSDDNRRSFPTADIWIVLAVGSAMLLSMARRMRRSRAKI